MRALCLVLALVFLATGPLGAASSSPPAAHWLLLSDIHFDPYDDPAIVDALLGAPASEWHDIFAKRDDKLSGFLKDTNFALLESSLAEMKTAISDPPLVVVSGDFLAHNFPEKFAKDEPKASRADYERFVDKTIAFLALELGRTYPAAQFLITIGNNDGYCGDYNSEAGSPFLAHMAAAWEPLVDRAGRAPDFVQSFSKGGYYTASLPASVPAQVVVMNSVFWSAKSANACGVPGSDPGAAEIAWLKQTVSVSPGGYRWFLTHIPPSVDAYSSMRAGKPVPFYDEKYLGDVLGLVGDAASHGATFIVGHEHHASFKLVGEADGRRVPTLVVPSISPVQLSNPAFLIADVDTGSGTIDDVTAYALPLEATPPVWQRDYDFDATYGVSALDEASLERVKSKLAADPAARESFEAHYPSGSKLGRMVDTMWPWYWCGMSNLTAATYARCTSDRSENPR